MSSSAVSFLSLIRLGIGHRSDALHNNIDWRVVESMAARHGLSAILIDGVEKLPDTQRPPKEMLLQWIGETLQSYEYRYEAYKKAIADLATFYNRHDLKMMLLKGYACSLDWPKPEHRPCGDIDIWLFGKQQEADATICVEKGIKIDCSHHHHTVFKWHSFTIENHYDFINTHAHKSSKELEKIFKEMGMDDAYTINVKGENVYVPSPNMNALFLLRHAMAHFAAQGINLRQLLDWAFFVEKHHNEIDWEWLEDVLDTFGMKRLYDILNAICVEDLGFAVSVFHSIKFEPSIKEKVLNEIISPEFSKSLPKNIIKRIVYKYKRWRWSAWKHELCFKESRCEAFWNGVCYHLLKPSSI